MRRASRTDATQAAIVDALRRVGCQVKDTSGVGYGFPDLVIRSPRGKIILMEVKTARGRLTPQQVAWHCYWPETVLVRTVEEALKATGAIR